MWLLVSGPSRASWCDVENVKNVAALNLPFGNINNPADWERVREHSLTS